MVLALAELLVSRHLRWLREYDLYLFQVPCVFFLFCMAMQLPLKEGRGWTHLRSLANIMYFTHVWVYKLLMVILNRVGLDLTTPGLLYLSAVAATLLLAEGLLCLGRKPGCTGLRQLYG